MADHEDANLILKLYDLRREAVMREARKWFAIEFHPNSAADVMAALQGPNSAYLRMLAGYWEMVAALVLHDTIDAELFYDTTGEYMFFFAKVEPFLEDVRKQGGQPRMMKSLEKLVRQTPQSAERLKSMRDNQRAMAQARP
ncbi:MAG TPA: hypothetical protein VFP94_06810 [Terriglobales bacterium]|nr:hypothetical protein [Terriglobales bacterium]